MIAYIFVKIVMGAALTATRERIALLFFEDNEVLVLILEAKSGNKSSDLVSR